MEELNEHIAYFKTHYLGGKNAPAAYDDGEDDYAGTDGADAPGGNANGNGTGSADDETDGNGGGKPGEAGGADGRDGGDRLSRGLGNDASYTTRRTGDAKRPERPKATQRTGAGPVVGPAPVLLE